MTRNFQRKERLTAMSEINVTPLIDLAFALLIIFMITAPLLQQTIDIQVPVESPKKQTTETETAILLSIDADGKFYWDGAFVSDVQMQQQLANLAKRGDSPVMQIQADAQLPYQRIVDLLDAIKKEGLTKLKLETRSR